jgi:hypothetical protein
MRMPRTSALSPIVALACATVLGVPFAPSAPGQAAKVISLAGQVSVIKNSVRGALKVGDTVLVRQLIVTGPDGFANFQVSDGSAFGMYPNSQATFRNNPGNWRDFLDLWLGRAKVRMQRFVGQPAPNSVQTPTAVISVRG